MIGTDAWRTSDEAFEVFLATVTAADLSEFELGLYRHHRFMKLKESK